LSAGRTVQWRLVARSGDRLSQILRAAQNTPPQATDLIVVSAGINDVLQGTSPARWKALLQALAQCFEQHFQARRVAFSGIPRIQEFTLLPQPLAWYLGLGAKRLNQATRQAVPGLPEAWRLVDLDLPLTSEFLARDGFHPNETASRIWCERVLLACEE
jgi:lysophospholipase L1-like esterase